MKVGVAFSVMRALWLSNADKSLQLETHTADALPQPVMGVCKNCPARKHFEHDNQVTEEIAFPSLQGNWETIC